MQAKDRDWKNEQSFLWGWVDKLELRDIKEKGSWWPSQLGPMKADINYIKKTVCQMLTFVCMYVCIYIYAHILISEFKLKSNPNNYNSTTALNWTELIQPTCLKEGKVNSLKLKKKKKILRIKFPIRIFIHCTKEDTIKMSQVHPENLRSDKSI